MRVVKRQKELIILIFLLITHFVIADSTSSLPDVNNVCTVTCGIKSIRMQYAAREQNLDQWCWAASIQMIFSYYNHDISQERIVEEVFGIAINVPAQPYHILQALNREWVDDDGNVFFCSTRPIPLQNGIISIIDELTNNKPLIIGTLGHAVVLTRIVYYLFPNGVVSVADAGVRDPWPGRGLRSLSINEFNNISFIAIVDIEDYL